MSLLDTIGSWFTGSNIAETVAAAHFEEATGAGIMDDDEHLYRALNAGQRDLIGPILHRAQDISVNLYRKNPLANRIINIYTTYMAGTGFTIEADNPDVQAVVNEFWQTERNQMEINHRRFARDKLLFGEAPHPVASDETGNTTIGYLDPQAIAHVETDPRNRLLLTKIVLTRLGGEGNSLDIVRRDEDPFSDHAGLLNGEIFFWLHDRIGAATRGTPFLLPAIDWLDAYDQVLWELLERTKAIRAFFWDVEVDGGKTEIEIAKKEWGKTAPRSGSVRFRTPAIKPEAQSPQIGAVEDVNTARYMLRHIATAAGVAPTWLGDPEDANRSTAEQMDKPVLQGSEDTQAQWKHDVGRLMAYVVDQKIAAGFLPRVVPRHDSEGNPTDDLQPASQLVRVNAPALTDDDVTAAAASLTSVAQAFMALDMIGGVDPETMRKVVRNMLPALGIPADELPDPEEADDATIAQAVESIRRRAIASGKLPELEAELARAGR